LEGKKEPKKEPSKATAILAFVKGKGELIR